MTPTDLLLTYLVHSTVLLGVAWFLDRFVLRDLTLKEVAWKSAVVAGLASTALAAGVEFAESAPGREVSRQVRVERTFAESLGASTASRLRMEWTVDSECAAAVTRREGLPPKSSGGLVQALDGCAQAAGPSAGWAFWGWVLGAGFLGIRWLLGMGRVLRLAAEARPVARRGSLSVRSSSRVQTPSAVGRSWILVPERALADFPPEELEAALAHEEAHLERGDPFWCWGLALLRAVAFFQPLNRVAARRLAMLSEVLSDDMARGRGIAPLDLARAIERVCAWRLHRPLLAPALGRPPGPTAQRIERLTSDASLEGSSMPNLRLALVCALFLVAGGLPRMGDRHDEGTAHVVVIVDEFEAGSHLSEGVW